MYFSIIIAASLVVFVAAYLYIDDKKKKEAEWIRLAEIKNKPEFRPINFRDEEIGKLYETCKIYDSLQDRYCRVDNNDTFVCDSSQDLNEIFSVVTRLELSDRMGDVKRDGKTYLSMPSSLFMHYNFVCLAKRRILKEPPKEKVILPPPVYLPPHKKFYDEYPPESEDEEIKIALVSKGKNKYFTGNEWKDIIDTEVIFTLTDFSRNGGLYHGDTVVMRNKIGILNIWKVSILEEIGDVGRFKIQKISGSPGNMIKNNDIVAFKVFDKESKYLHAHISKSYKINSTDKVGDWEMFKIIFNPKLNQGVL